MCFVFPAPLSLHMENIFNNLCGTVLSRAMIPLVVQESNTGHCGSLKRHFTAYRVPDLEHHKGE